MSGQGKLGSLAFMASADMTVLKPPRRKAASIASRWTVKFMFTGTLPAQMTDRLAIRAPTPGGRTIPTRPSGTVFRRWRDRAIAAPSSLAAVTGLRSWVQSTTTIRPGLFARDRTTSRPMWRRRTGRSSKASDVRLSMAWRVVSRSAFSARMGRPKATKTAVGISRGDFQMYFFSAKEKTEPQSPSIAAGMTRTPAARAIASKPGLMRMS